MNSRVKFQVRSQKPPNLFANWLGAPLNGFATKAQNFSPQPDLTGFVVQPRSFAPPSEAGPSSSTSSYAHMRTMAGAGNGKKFQGFHIFLKLY